MSDATVQQPDDTPEQMRVRREKRERLLAQGSEAYPVEIPRTHTLAEIRAEYPDLEPDTATGTIVGVAGRVMFSRNTGKLCFATLQEGDGTQLQVMLSLAGVGEEALAAWKSEVDHGDIVVVHGEVISSRRGELSVMADSWTMASKALRPLPVAHKEMNEEARVRQRGFHGFDARVDLARRGAELAREDGGGRGDGVALRVEGNHRQHRVHELAEATARGPAGVRPVARNERRAAS